jgi:hypothetical protein
VLASPVVLLGAVGGWVAIAGRFLVSANQAGPADAVMVALGRPAGMAARCWG